MFDPLETVPENAEVDISVVGCELDPDTGIITITFELTSDEEYRTVLLNGEASDGSDVVIATGSATVTNVRPGQTYRQDIVLASSSTPPQGEITCDVTLDFAQPGF